MSARAETGSSWVERARSLPPIAADVALLVLLLALRTWLFAKFYFVNLFSANQMLEEMIYSTVSLDLSRGLYWAPIVHGYGIPFHLYWLTGKFLQLFDRPVFAIGYFHFLADSLLAPIVYVVGKRFFDRGVGLLAAFLAVLSPVYSYWSTLLILESAIFQALALYFIHLALRRRQAGLLLLAGLLFGFSHGGSRFSPFFILATALWLLWTRPPSLRLRRSIVFLGLGYLLSATPMIIGVIQRPALLLGFLGGLSGGGIDHFVMDRPLWGGLPSKVFEFLFPFVVYQPFVTIPFFAALVALIRRRRDSESDPAALLLWFNVGVLAFALTFLVTYREPSALGSFLHRPLRYFFVFTPFIELLAAQWVMRMLRRVSPEHEMRLARAVCLAFAGAVFIIGLSMRAPVGPPSLFDKLGVKEESTLLTNLFPQDTYRYYTGHWFPLGAGAVMSKEKSSLPAMELYAFEAFRDPLRVEFTYHGVPVHVRSWFMNMPIVDLAKVFRLGQPVGPALPVYFDLASKAKIAAEVTRLRDDRNFSETFRAALSDRDLMKRLNPQLPPACRVITDNADEEIVKCLMPTVAYRDLKLRFDRREAGDPSADFIAPPGLPFFGFIGFGWHNGINLYTAEDPLVKNELRLKFQRGLVYDEHLWNEFYVRVRPGRYTFTIVCKPLEFDKPVLVDFPGSTVVHITRTFNNEWMTEEVVLDANDGLVVSFGKWASFLLYSMELHAAR